MFKSNNDIRAAEQAENFSQSNAQGLFDDYNSQNDFGGKKVY